ncbi:hypothetical protein FRC01_009565 [Tulasnella sp. 417]|nr:hypothetical protein FRC01_009565 [Tulasnella sp. 417]
MPNDPAGTELDYNGLVKPQIDTLGPSTEGKLRKRPQKKFVYKLWEMLEDPASKEYIHWTPDGCEFIVTDHEEFARLILLRHFNYSTFSSFFRQLDMYDFRKRNRERSDSRFAQAPGTTAQRRGWIVSHPRFIRGRPDLLQSIKPKANEGNVPIQYSNDQLQPSLILQSSSTTLGRRQHPPFDSLFPKQRYFRFGRASSRTFLLISTLPDIRSLMNSAQVQGPPLAPPFVTLPEGLLPSPEGPLSDPLRSLEMKYHGSRQASQSFYDVSEEGSFDDGDEQDPGMRNDPAGIELDYNGLVKPQIDTLGPSTEGKLRKRSQKNFVYKLWEMLEDPAAKEYIQWGLNGREFIVTNHEEFARLILSEYFMYSDFSSFVRQLGMYDFHKTNRGSRSLRGTAQHQLWIFSHLRFVKGRPDLLHLIERKGSYGYESNLPIEYGEGPAAGSGAETLEPRFSLFQY